MLQCSIPMQNKYCKPTLKTFEQQIRPLLNLSLPNVTCLYPLKTSANFIVFWCFQGAWIHSMGKDWLCDFIIDFEPIIGTKYSRMNQVKFVEESLYKFWRVMVCFKYLKAIFKGCLPQILLGPFLNTIVICPLRLFLRKLRNVF